MSVGVPELQNTPVDTTGAGDAFLGALAHLITSGRRSKLPYQEPSRRVDVRAAARRPGLTPRPRTWAGRTAAGPPSPASATRAAVDNWCSAAATEAVDKGRRLGGRRHRLRPDRDLLKFN